MFISFLKKGRSRGKWGHVVLWGWGGGDSSKTGTKREEGKDTTGERPRSADSPSTKKPPTSNEGGKKGEKIRVCEVGVRGGGWNKGKKDKKTLLYFPDIFFSAETLKNPDKESKKTSYEKKQGSELGGFKQGPKKKKIPKNVRGGGRKQQYAWGGQKFWAWVQIRLTPFSKQEKRVMTGRHRRGEG